MDRNDNDSSFVFDTNDSEMKMELEDDVKIVDNDTKPCDLNFKIWLKFEWFCDCAGGGSHDIGHAGALEPNLLHAVSLLSILRMQKCMLNAHQTLMLWHLTQSGTLKNGEELHNVQLFLARMSCINS